jgi:D-arabinose 1-dehydrogenase-like Zn-dependent alcohol dehydrogenase
MSMMKLNRFCCVSIDAASLEITMSWAPNRFAIDKINEAYERTLKSDMKYRFVIDMASLA